jgi:predicted short-subunit dehydrogenase-like oxidoreductase (DUF2520 family)
MRNSTTPPDHVRVSVAVVGTGRLGTALARALDAAAVEVSGPLGRGEVPLGDVMLLCVPDEEIAAAADAARAAGFDGPIGHTSGATPLAVLEGEGRAAFALHPLQTFAGGEAPERFRGIGCAVAGSTPSALATARALAERLGMRPFELADSQRAAYHAAASVASNFLVTLQAAAEELAAGAGLERGEARELLAPLVRSTVENWASRGPERALTGPVARGDLATVERQRQAVESVAAHLLPLFDELVERTEAVASTRSAVTA